MCFGDQENAKIPAEHRIPLPALPGLWPPDGATKEKVAEDVSTAWCDVLKKVVECCKGKPPSATSTSGSKPSPGDTPPASAPLKPKIEDCSCKQCLLKSQFDKGGDFAGNLQIIKDELAKNPELAKKIKGKCPGLPKPVDGLWGNGLPQPITKVFPCKDIK